MSFLGKGTEFSTQDKGIWTPGLETFLPQSRLEWRHFPITQWNTADKLFIILLPSESGRWPFWGETGKRHLAVVFPTNWVVGGNLTFLSWRNEEVGSWALTRTSRKAELLRGEEKSCLAGQYPNSVTWLDWSRKDFTKIKEIKLRVPLQDSGNNQHKLRLETGLRGGKKEEHDKHKA